MTGGPNFETLTWGLFNSSEAKLVEGLAEQSLNKKTTQISLKYITCLSVSSLVSSNDILVIRKKVIGGSSQCKLTYFENLLPNVQWEHGDSIALSADISVQIKDAQNFQYTKP